MTMRASHLLLLFALLAPAFAEDEKEERENKDEVPVALTPDKERAEKRTETLPEAEKKPSPAAQDSLAWAIDGYLMLDTRYRNADGENDVDVYLHAYADASKKAGDGKTWRVLFNGRLIWRATSRRDPTDFTYNFWDTYDGDVQVRLYETFFEGRGLSKGNIDIRVGRQFLDEGVYFHVDGARRRLPEGENAVHAARGHPGPPERHEHRRQLDGRLRLPRADREADAAAVLVLPRRRVLPGDQLAGRRSGAAAHGAARHAAPGRLLRPDGLAPLLTRTCRSSGASRCSTAAPTSCSSARAGSRRTASGPPSRSGTSSSRGSTTSRTT